MVNYAIGYPVGKGMKADKGRTTKGVFIRLSVQEYEWLLGKSSDGVGGYIREMIKRAYGKRLSVQPLLYNPSVHKVGDRVLVRRGKKLVEMTVPGVDIDGNVMP